MSASRTPPLSAMFSPRVSLPLSARPGQRLEAGVLVDDALRSRVELPCASSGVHQSRRLPLRVELAALVVEAVGQFVADDGADAAVVDGVVACLGSKNGGCRMPAGKLMSFICGL